MTEQHIARKVGPTITSTRSRRRTQISGTERCLIEAAGMTTNGGDCEFDEHCLLRVQRVLPLLSFRQICDAIHALADRNQEDELLKLGGALAFFGLFPDRHASDFLEVLLDPEFCCEYRGAQSLVVANNAQKLGPRDIEVAIRPRFTGGQQHPTQEAKVLLALLSLVGIELPESSL